MEWLVGLLDLLDPHVQGVEFLLDEIVEVIGRVEDTVDGTHEEREEGQTHEFEDDGENVLFGGGTRVITIAYCCDDLKDPIERENILGVFQFAGEVIGIDPGLGAVCFFCWIFLSLNCV